MKKILNYIKNLFSEKQDNETQDQNDILFLIDLKIEELEKQREASKALIPQYYQEYQRAMFDEWKRLVPDLAEHNERFYQSLQNRNY